MSELILQAMEKLQRGRDELHRETIEQSRLLGMSGEREADLRGKVMRLERELVEAREQLDEALSNLEFRRELYVVLAERCDRRTVELAETRDQRDRLERELATALRDHDNALSDWTQADTDSIRALHERNEAREQRDTLAVICGELIAAIRVNSMRDTFREATHNQIEEWLKQWVDKLAAAKGGTQ
jgi:hypothetical protein